MPIPSDIYFDATLRHLTPQIAGGITLGHQTPITPEAIDAYRRLEVLKLLRRKPIVTTDEICDLLEILPRDARALLERIKAEVSHLTDCGSGRWALRTKYPTQPEVAQPKTAPAAKPPADDPQASESTVSVTVNLGVWEEAWKGYQPLRQHAAAPAKTQAVRVYCSDKAELIVTDGKSYIAIPADMAQVVARMASQAQILQRMDKPAHEAAHAAQPAEAKACG